MSSTRDVRVTASGPHNPSSPPWNIMSVSVRGLHSAAPGSLFRSADSVARQSRLTCRRFRLISGLERTRPPKFRNDDRKPWRVRRDAGLSVPSSTTASRRGTRPTRSGTPVRAARPSPRTAPRPPAEPRPSGRSGPRPELGSIRSRWTWRLVDAMTDAGKSRHARRAGMTDATSAGGPVQLHQHLPVRLRACSAGRRRERRADSASAN